jgi:ATP synthase protein I
VSPGSSAVGFMVWEMVKIGVSVALLMAAPRVLQHLSWPALLVAMVVCMKVYWVALLWRGRSV